MRAVRIAEPGGPDVLETEHVPRPEPGPGEVLLQIEAAGVNFIDVYQRTGLYAVDPPFTPGMEAAGTVAAVADGVSDWALGDRAAYAMVRGSYADYATVAADRLVAVPDDVALSTAAAVTLQGLTAQYLATGTYPIREGDTALVHAGAGGVGLLLTQVIASIGGRVISTVSNQEKAALAREAGADEVILYTEQDVVAEVRRHTGGRGAEVVYDSVGKDTFDDSLDSLAPRGMLVLFGQSSGHVAPLDIQRLNSGGSLYVTRPSLAHYTADPQELRARAAQVLGWVSSGDLSVRIHTTMRLDEAATAHRMLEGRETAGKVLLIP